MDLAAVLIPPSLDAKQALRLRRVGLAALGYTLSMALVAVAWMFGVLPASAALEVAAAYLAINLALYAAIRSGFNLRFDDPSLTRVQILAAITVLMYVVYHMDDGRNIALFACFIVFLFGIFRLNARESTLVTLYALAAYALVINLLMHLRPQAIHDVPGEWMSWLGLAGFLPCFTIIGGQINALRRKLRESEARFRSLTEMSSDFYWASDAEHRLTDHSLDDKKVSSASLFRKGVGIGERSWEIPHLSPDEAGWRAHRAVLDAHRPFRDFELSRLGIDGTERHVSISGDPVFDASGAFTGYRGVGRDITERHLADSALRESEARFRRTFELAGSGIAQVSLDGRFLRVNRSLCAILGYSDTDLVGRTVKELSHPEDRDKTDAARARVRSGELESMRSGKRYLRKDGATVWVDLSVALVRDAEGTPLYEIAVFDDDTERKNAESALRVSEARFRSLTEMSSDFYWESDATHRLTDHGSAGRKVSTVSVFRQDAQIRERRWEIPYLSPDEAGWRAHRAVLDAHLPFRDFELSRLGIDGTERHISISGDPVFDALGAFKGYRGVGAEITARKRSEQALRDSAQQLRLFADNVPAMIAYWDDNLRCRFASKVFAEFYGLTIEDIIGKHMRELMGEDVYRDGEVYAAQVRQGHPVTYQRKRRLKNGESRYLEMRLLPHIGDRGKVVGSFAVTIDITEHKLTEERIQRVAHHDGLTGLPNRLLFNDRLDQAISIAKRDRRQFALLYLDLDKFKPVNDALGHTAGDELLKGVAARIRRQVRESDTVARVGGDEFIVILRDITRREEAEIVARKIIAAFAAPFQIGGQKQSVAIGTSIGIAVYPGDARDADGLVSAADAAMYSAKQAGNSFRFCAA